MEAVWFVDWDDGDWLGCVYRKSSTEPWEAVYRFRYKRDNKVFGSADKKSAYRLAPKQPKQNGTTDAARDELVKAIAFMAGAAATLYSGRLEHVPVHGGMEAMKAATKDKPWMHIRFMPFPPGANSTQ